MKYRPQRGGLIDSMNECVSIPATVEALTAVLQKQMDFMQAGLIIPADAVTITACGYDVRVCWDTYLVSVNGQGVGFTDGPLDGSGLDLTPDNCCFDHWLSQEKCAACNAIQRKRERESGTQPSLFDSLEPYTHLCHTCGQPCRYFLCHMCRV